MTGIIRVEPSIRSGPDFCPRVTTLNNSAEILVPNGAEKSIKLRLEHIAQFITWTRLVCQFNIEGRVTSVNAKIVRDTVICDPMEFTFTSR